MRLSGGPSNFPGAGGVSIGVVSGLCFIFGVMLLWVLNLYLMRDAMNIHATSVPVLYFG